VRWARRRDRRLRRNRSRKTNIDLVVADIAATAGLLRARPEVAGKVAAIGYCLGGRLAYLAAATGKIDAAVAYYGGGIQSCLDVVDKIAQPILFHFAENDHAIPLSGVDDVKATFASRDNATFYLYPGAEHGFNCTDRAASALEKSLSRSRCDPLRARELDWQPGHPGAGDPKFALLGLIIGQVG
jgi:dienelactone hydrolase